MDELTRNKKEFGERVRKRRKEIGMAMDELAKRMGYSHRSSIKKIENGENSIPQDKVEPLANCLNTTVEYLMGWEKPISDKVLAEYLVELSEEFLGSTLPTSEEIKLISLYRKASDRDRKLIDSILSSYEGDET